tara:strand:- start:118 stop:357 length:240 start_codon:yes stop_codon:yes gene_type:complete
MLNLTQEIEKLESLKQREQRKGYMSDYEDDTMTTWKEQHVAHLKEEIEIIKTRLQPHDTGHLHDYIANMKRRVEELDGE